MNPSERRAMRIESERTPIQSRQVIRLLDSYTDCDRARIAAESRIYEWVTAWNRGDETALSQLAAGADPGPTDDYLDGLRQSITHLHSQLERQRQLNAHLNAHLSSKLDRIRDLTGVVVHTNLADCVGCGCMSMDAEEAVIDAMADFAQSRLMNVSLGDKLRTCSETIAGLAERCAGQSELLGRRAEVAAGPELYDEFSPAAVTEDR